MNFIADLHVHSRFSIATSKEMDLAHIHRWAQLKGIHVVATGDCTHPKWFQEIQEQLKPLGNGLFSLSCADAVARVTGIELSRASISKRACLGDARKGFRCSRAVSAA